MQNTCCTLDSCVTCCTWHSLAMVLHHSRILFAAAASLVLCYLSLCCAAGSENHRLLQHVAMHMTCRPLKLSYASLLGRKQACAAALLCRYQLQNGELPRKSVRMCSMVDTRAMQGMKAFQGSNNFSFIGVPICTDEATPLQRLAAVHNSLLWIRNSMAVLLATYIPSIVMVRQQHAYHVVPGQNPNTIKKYTVCTCTYLTMPK